MSQGIGISVKQAEILMAMDEDLLWSLGCLGTSHPQQLLNTVIFSIGKGFALCAGQEHRVLHGLPFNSQFTFMRDPDGEVFLCYTEDIGLKMNKGGLKHHKVNTKTMDLYGTENPDRCPLRAIVKYLSLLPKNRTCTAFYLQPWRKWFGKAWYMNRPAGVNTLQNAVREMCHNAGLPGYYTNHSLFPRPPPSCTVIGLMSSLSWRSLVIGPLQSTHTKGLQTSRGSLPAIAFLPWSE